MFLIYSIIIIVIPSKSHQFLETTCPFYFPQCKCFNSDDLICDSFENFKELSFAYNRMVKFLSFIPKKSLKIDKNLNLSELSFHNELTLSLRNIEGFEFFYNFKNHIDKLTSSTLQVQNSSIQFYFNDNELLNFRCSRFSIEPKHFPIFSSFKNILLDNVKFLDKICIFIFQNSNISRLIIKNITYENKIEFFSTSNSSINSLNSTIYRFEIDSSIIKTLGQNFLPYQIFASLKELVFTNSEINSIDDHLFKNTPNLRILIFSLNNFEYFIRQRENSWMQGLNQNSNDELLIGFIDTKQKFKFSDQDFCSFYRFPHEKNVYAYIKTSASLECSCTLVWLLKNYRQSNQSSLILSSESVFDCLKSPEFNQKLQECNFDKRIKECANNPDKYLATQLILSFLIIILFAFFCFLVFKSKLVKKVYSRFMTEKEYYHTIHLSQTITVFYDNNKILRNFDKLAETLDFWFKKGIISQTKNLEWSLPIKSCEKFAFIDFRDLNSMCVKSDLFNIDELTKRLLNSRHYSKIQIKDFDLKIKLDENSKYYTSFNCHLGQFKFNYVPSGLATFYHAIKDYLKCILGKHLNQSCFIFFDSLIIYSKCEKEHNKLLADIIGRLEKSNLQICRVESFFNKTEIRFNKNLIRYQKCTYNFKTIDFIKSINLPKDKVELKKFLSFFSLFKSKIQQYDLFLENYHNVLEQHGNFSLNKIQKDHLYGIKNQVINLIAINLNNLTELEVHIHLRKNKSQYLLIMFGKIDKNDLNVIPVFIRKEHIKTDGKLNEEDLIFKLISKVFKKIRCLVLNKKFKLLCQNYNRYRHAFCADNSQYLDLISKTQQNNLEIKNLDASKDYEEFLEFI